MRINHNIASLNTYRQLTANGANSSKSLEKLSSGLRINRAGDDAAGLAISEKMRGQIRGLDQAQRNAQDGISLIQTAEGALNETHSILQRMRELGVQASNDTNTSVDRGEIQKEINQLVEEIDRIADTTEFNTKKLLNGEVGVTAFSSNAAQVKNVSVGSETTAGTYAISAVTLATTTAVGTTGVTLGDNIAADGALDGTRALSTLASTTVNTGAAVTINGKSFTFDSTKTINELKNQINAASGETGVTADFTITSNADGTADTISWTFTSTKAGSEGQVSVTGATGIFNGTYSVSTVGKDATFTIAGTDELSASITLNASDYSVKGNTVTYTAGNAEGLKFDVSNTTGATITVSDDNKLNFQIGANAGQTMEVAIQDMGSASLSIDNIDVSSKTSANAAVTSIQSAIEKVSAERSKLGAYQNRLEHTINNLGTSSENLTASESRIRDVDMAKEMMEFTKNNILNQAATAMLAQANQTPQSVLSLLQ